MNDDKALKILDQGNFNLTKHSISAAQKYLT